MWATCLNRHRCFLLSELWRREEPEEKRDGYRFAPPILRARCHPPRKRGIQYAAALRLIPDVSGILGRPVKPGDDSCVAAPRRPLRFLIHFSNSHGHDFIFRELQTHLYAPRRQAPGLCQIAHRPRDNRGRGECRDAQKHPQPRVQKTAITHTSIHSEAPETPGIPARNGFTAYTRSPRR